MTPQEFIDEFGTLAESAEGVPKLRELILELAVRGKLVEQDENDEPASVAFRRIRSELEDYSPARSVRKAKNDSGNTSTDSVDEDGLPVGWIACALDQISVIVYGKGLPTKKLLLDGYPVFGANGIIGCYSEFLYEDTQLLISCRGAYSGKINMSPPKCFITNNSLVVELTGTGAKMRPFLFHALSAANKEKLVTGSAQPQVTVTNTKHLRVWLPPLAEQHRIVSKVDELMGLCDRLEAVQGERRGVRVRLNRSSLDRLTSSSTARGSGLSAAWQRVCDHFQVLYDTPETLPDLRQTILQLAVQGKLVKQDPNDEPAEALLGQIAEKRASLIEQKHLKKSKTLPAVDKSEIDFSIPSSWSLSRLGHCCLNITDGFHNTPKTVDSGVPLLMAKDVKPHCLDFNNGLFVSEADHRELVSKTRPKRGDLLVVNIGAGSGTPAVIDVDFEFSFKNVAILNRPNEVDSEYLFTFLLATQAATFDELTQGGAQPFLSLARLRSKPFPLPPLSEQKRIVSKVTDLLSQVTRLESTLTRREATRTQLLTAAIHAMLNGEDNG